jgi:glyoxylate reductase
MEKGKVLVTVPLLGKEIENLKTMYEIVQCKGKKSMSREEILKEIETVDALLCVGNKIDKEVIDKGKNLKVISQAAVGIDNIDVKYCTKKGIPVGNTPDVLVSATANIGMLHILNGLRGFVKGGNDIKKGKWISDDPSFTLGRELEGKTLVIVGFGKIGRNIAKKALAFDFNVFACSPHFKESIIINGKEVKPVTFEQGIKIADVLSLNLPLTESTVGLINKDVLKQMKNDSILVNMARGPIVNTSDLYEALLNNEIGYASLDVLDPEPIPKDHPLLDLENVFITPHMGSSTVETRTKMADLAVRNIIRGLKGQKLEASVNQHLI